MKAEPDLKDLFQTALEPENRKKPVTPAKVDYGPHECWYEFLKLSNPTNWTPAVHEDFDDVLTSPSFGDWIMQPDKLFELFSKYGHIATWDTVEQFVPVRPLKAGDNLDNINFDTHAVLVIDRRLPWMTLEKLVKLRADLIEMPKKKAQKEKLKDTARGSRDFMKSEAKWPLEKRFQLVPLNKCLYVYKLRKEHEGDKDMPYWKIGVLAKQKYPDILDGLPKDTDEQDIKEKLHDQVNDWLIRAEKIIKGVEKGVFPAA